MKTGYDAQIDKPATCSDGYSDPVAVLTSDGQVVIAVWDSRDGYWHSFENGEEDTFGNVRNWAPLPGGWPYDSDLYLPVMNGCQIRTDEKSKTVKEYQDRWRNKK